MFFLLFGHACFGQTVASLRGLLREAQKSASAAESLSSLSERGFAESKSPVLLAYFAVSQFMRAEHDPSPLAKLSYFRTGRALLDDSVRREPGSVEIRLLRYLSQKNSPKILGYTKNMREDRAFLLSHYPIETDRFLKELISKEVK